MPLLDLVTLPVRLTRAAVDTTLALGLLVDPQLGLTLERLHPRIAELLPGGRRRPAALEG